MRRRLNRKDCRVLGLYKGHIDKSRVVGLLVVEIPIIILALVNLLPEEPILSGYVTLLGLSAIFLVIMPLSAWFLVIKRFGQDR